MKGLERFEQSTTGPIQITCHQKAPVYIRVENTGKQTWTDHRLHPVDCTYNGPQFVTPDGSFDHNDIELPEIPPGRDAWITRYIDGRSEPGLYQFKFRMLDADGKNCFPKTDIIVRLSVHVVPEHEAEA